MMVAHCDSLKLCQNIVDDLQLTWLCGRRIRLRIERWRMVDKQTKQVQYETITKKNSKTEINIKKIHKKRHKIKKEPKNQLC